jgi:hypothetical protein
MYCPKCGTENVDTNESCRACRENLGVISQAMKQRLPVLIASRLDQLLDSRSERFRRDRVVYFSLGIVGLIAGASRISGIGALIAAGVSFMAGVWSYLPTGVAWNRISIGKCRRRRNLMGTVG